MRPSQFKEFERAILGAAGGTSCALDGHTDLAKAHPCAEATQITMVFRHPAGHFVYYPSRQQAESLRVEWQGRRGKVATSPVEQ